MRLPKMPFSTQGQWSGVATRRQQIIQFGGLDYTDAARAGKFSACQNLSAQRYPVISPRKGRAVYSDAYSAPSAAFAWDGKLLVVDNGTVIYDGVTLGTVTPGPKQFAVVNTKLCIWPDKVYVDLTNNTFQRLNTSVKTTGVAGSTTFTENSLTAVTVPRAREDQTQSPAYTGSALEWNPCVYCYGTSRTAVEACWDAENGEWNSVSLTALESLRGIFTPNGTGIDGTVSTGYIFIPEVSGSNIKYIAGDVVFGDPDVVRLPDKTRYNQQGYYGVFTATEPGDYVGVDNSRMKWHYDIYKVSGAKVFSGVFEVGDGVDITGTLYGLLDLDKGMITGFDDATNTILFPDGTFRIPKKVKYFSSPLAAAATLAISTTASVGGASQTVYYSVELPYALEGKPTFVLWEDTPEFDSLPATAEVTIWDANAKVSMGTITMDVTAAAPAGYTEYAFAAYATDTKVLTIQRDVPDLDFICESENRLWGVSNSQTDTVWNEETKRAETFTSRVIYASALGQPTQWWTFEGLATDSWQVAVGSEGDFTGMIAYGGAVCCFKERRLVRVLGSYPSQYSTAEDETEGVAAGSSKSLVTVGGALLYHGPNGIYAYGGGTPRLLSADLGLHRYSNAVAGTDGQRYYVSMQEGTAWHVLVYDALRGLWLREDATHAVDFCRLGSDLLMLTAAGALLTIDGAATDPASAPVAWSLEFAPFKEEEPHSRIKVLRLLLRVESPPGTGTDSLSVWVKYSDTYGWRRVKTLTQGADSTVVVPVWPNRMDRVGVRITGTGPWAVTSLAREYLDGSEYGGEGFSPAYKEGPVS